MFPRLRDGAVLRVRHSSYASDSDQVVVAPDGTTYTLTSEYVSFLLACDGKTPQSHIPIPNGDWNDPDLLPVISLEPECCPINPHQYVVTDNVVIPCRYVIWHLTRDCDMRCRHCYYLYQRDQKSSFAPNEITSIAERLWALGVETVRLSGVEVALYSRGLDTAVRALTEWCVPTIINTNGWHKQDWIVSTMRNNPYMRAVQVSLDGPRKAHNEMRQSDSFDEISRNISHYVEAGVHVRLISMLTEGWMDRKRVGEMCRHVSSLGVVDWVIEIPSATGLWTRDSTTCINHTVDVAQALREFLETQDHALRSFSFTQVFDWPHQDVQQKTLTDPICSHDLGLFTFGPEGISYCTLFREQFGSSWKDLGRLETGDYKELWNRIARQRVSRVIGDNPACANCNLFPICQGGCPGQYENAASFSGCDYHSRNLALAKLRFFAKNGWSLP